MTKDRICYTYICSHNEQTLKLMYRCKLLYTYLLFSAHKNVFNQCISSATSCYKSICISVQLDNRNHSQAFKWREYNYKCIEKPEGEKREGAITQRLVTAGKSLPPPGLEEGRGKSCCMDPASLHSQVGDHGGTVASETISPLSCRQAKTHSPCKSSQSHCPSCWCLSLLAAATIVQLLHKSALALVLLLPLSELVSTYMLRQLQPPFFFCPFPNFHPLSFTYPVFFIGKLN